MKKQIKILLLSVVMAVIILLITPTIVKAETYNVQATLGPFSDDGRTTATFTLPEVITGVDRLTGSGWTVNEDTATKSMARGETFYYEQTNIEGDVYRVIIAVPMQVKVGSTTTFTDAFTDFTSDNTQIININDSGIVAVAPGTTNVRAKKAIGNGQTIDYVWSFTVISDGGADSENTNPENTNQENSDSQNNSDDNTTPATGTEETSEENISNTDNNKEENKLNSTDDKAENKGNTNGKNGTEAKEKISQAGSNLAIVLFVIAGLGIVAVISKKKLTNNKF